MKTKLNFYYIEKDKKIFVQESKINGKITPTWVSTVVVENEEKEKIFIPVYGC